MYEKICSFYHNIAKHKQYWCIVIFFILFAYGFSLTRNTLSIDDLSSYAGVDIASGRWGMRLWYILSGRQEYSPYIFKFLGVVLFGVSGSLLSCLFYSLLPENHNTSVYPYTFLSAVFITFPLINEIWEYNGANYFVAGNFAVAFLSILFILFGKMTYIKKTLISGIMMSIVVSSYESVVFVYITTIFCVLFYRFCILKEKSAKWYQWITEGARFIPCLLIAIVIRYIVQQILMAILGLSPTTMGSTDINWNSFSLINLRVLINQTIDAYVFKFEYLPILLFVLSMGVFGILIVFRCIHCRSLLPIVIGICIMASLFLLEIIQFLILPYRTAQGIGLFVAFVVFLLLDCVRHCQKSAVQVITVVICFFVTVYQSGYLSWTLEMNHLRSENELLIVRYLGSDLVRNYDTQKLIVFCGEYHIGDYIENRIGIRATKEQLAITHYPLYDNEHRIFETNVNSVINWSLTAFEDDETINQMKSLFSYCGYDLNIKKGYLKEIQKYTEKAESLHMKPLETRDMGDYILVYLGAD